MLRSTVGHLLLILCFPAMRLSRSCKSCSIQIAPDQQPGHADSTWNTSSRSHRSYMRDLSAPKDLVDDEKGIYLICPTSGPVPSSNQSDAIPPLPSATPAGQGPPVRHGLFHSAGRASGARTVLQTGAGKVLVSLLLSVRCADMYTDTYSRSFCRHCWEYGLLRSFVFCLRVLRMCGHYVRVQ